MSASTALVCTVELNKESGKGITIKIENASKKITQTIILDGESITTMVKGQKETSKIVQKDESIAITCKTFTLKAETITCETTKGEYLQKSADKFTVESAKDMKHKSSAKMDLEATGDMTFKGSANVKTTATSNIEMKATADLKAAGMNVDLKGTTAFKAEGAQVGITGKAKAEIKAPMIAVSGDAKLDLKAALVGVDGSGMLKAKGAMTMIG